MSKSAFLSSQWDMDVKQWYWALDEMFSKLAGLPHSGYRSRWLGWRFVVRIKIPLISNKNIFLIAPAHLSLFLSCLSHLVWLLEQAVNIFFNACRFRWFRERQEEICEMTCGDLRSRRDIKMTIRFVSTSGKIERRKIVWKFAIFPPPFPFSLIWCVVSWT